MMLFVLSIHIPAYGQSFPDRIIRENVKCVVDTTVKWQNSNLVTKGRAVWCNPQYTGWADGVYLSALADWSVYTDNKDFQAWYYDIAEMCNWEPAPRTVDPANDIAVSLMYASIWLQNPQPKNLFGERMGDFEFKDYPKLLGGWKQLIPTIERLDYQIKYFPDTDNLDLDIPENHERWSWCDALYMAAPTYALYSNITGNDEYREFMNREFWMAIDAFYDKEECLIYRDLRYVNEKSGNGAKLFWGRGNGWVIGALCRVLSFLPEDYPDRVRYEELLRRMLERLVKLQDDKGFWNTSLLDREYYPNPETSATGFFTYGLWWAVNNGILPEETYLPYARKGWSALVSSVHDNGMLGYVQPIGDSPDNITRDKNEVYGTAAFILSGFEILRYLSEK
jgi:hypothetical protein